MWPSRSASMAAQGCVPPLPAALPPMAQVQHGGDRVGPLKRPGSARGVRFVTLEDETGVANLVILGKDLRPS